MKVNTDKNTPRLLGAAFLIVFLASLISGSLFDSAVGTGSISSILINISKNAALLRVSIIIELVTSLGIVALAALLYIVFRKHYPIVALIAFGWWLAEGIILAVSKIGAFALIPLSMNYVQAGAPVSSYYQALGDFFYYGFDRQGWTLHMVFFSIGAILWYSLFYRSRSIPRVLSAWGVISVSIVAVNVFLTLLSRDAELILVMLAPYVVFEGLIGPWLMIKGMRVETKSAVPVLGLENP
jgi:hypothetical protein